MHEWVRDARMAQSSRTFPPGPKICGVPVPCREATVRRGREDRGP